MALVGSAGRRLAAGVPALGAALGVRWAAKKAVVEAAPTGLAIKDEDLPTTIPGGQAFPGDLRSTSALGVGDGLKTHTAKWLQVRERSWGGCSWARTPSSVLGQPVLLLMLRWASGAGASLAQPSSAGRG